MSDLYDNAALGKLVADKIKRLGCGYRAAAKTMGIGSPDITRAVKGQSIDAGKVIAMCDWVGMDVRTFYRPDRTAHHTFDLGEDVPRAKKFHVNSSETVCANGQEWLDDHSLSGGKYV